MNLPQKEAGTATPSRPNSSRAKASLSSIMGIPADEQSFFLAGVNIGQVMSAPAVSIDIGASVQEAAGLMAERKIGCLTVLEGGKFCGLITETDVLRCFAGLVTP